MVPLMRIYGGALTMSISRRRIASTSPTRVDVPSITSTIAPSCPSGFGPEGESPGLPERDRGADGVHLGGVSAFGVVGGFRSRET